jgi:hypothetical protein
VRNFVIDKNLRLYCWLRKIFGKKLALGVANQIEDAILALGREYTGKKLQWFKNAPRDK